MPFTFAHPAAVLPFRSAKASTTALVIGSMSPDFEYFLRGRPQGTFAHSLAGLVLFCIPMSLVAMILFERLCKRPVILLLPTWLRSRVAGTATPFSRMGMVVVCVVIGALTHLLWDAFTHPFGTAVRNLPALSYTVAQVPLFRVFQHAGSLLGLALVGLFAYSQLQKREPRPDTSPKLRDAIRVSVWILLFVVATAAFVRPFLSADSLRSALGVALVQSIDAAVLGLLLFSVAAQLRLLRELSIGK